MIWSLCPGNPVSSPLGRQFMARTISSGLLSPSSGLILVPVTVCSRVVVAVICSLCLDNSVSSLLSCAHGSDSPTCRLRLLCWRRPAVAAAAAGVEERRVPCGRSGPLASPRLTPPHPASPRSWEAVTTAASQTERWPMVGQLGSPHRSAAALWRGVRRAGVARPVSAPCRLKLAVPLMCSSLSPRLT